MQYHVSQWIVTVLKCVEAEVFDKHTTIRGFFCKY